MHQPVPSMVYLFTLPIMYKEWGIQIIGSASEKATQGLLKRLYRVQARPRRRCRHCTGKGPKLDIGNNHEKVFLEWNPIYDCSYLGCSCTLSLVHIGFRVRPVNICMKHNNFYLGWYWIKRLLYYIFESPEFNHRTTNFISSSAC